MTYQPTTATVYHLALFSLQWCSRFAFSPSPCRIVHGTTSVYKTPLVEFRDP